MLASAQDSPEQVPLLGHPVDHRPNGGGNSCAGVCPRRLHLYLRHHGRPVVCIWGFGFNDSSHPGTAAQCVQTIDWFKAAGCTVKDDDLARVRREMTAEVASSLSRRPRAASR